LATLGQVQHHLGNVQQARQCLCEGLCTAAKIGADVFISSTLPRIAVFLLGQGQEQRAVEIYALASRDPHVANSRWFEDTAGRHIAAAEESLLPERVAAAQARGCARDLRATAEELANELGDTT
jgi:hypothetical protein